LAKKAIFAAPPMLFVVLQQIEDQNFGILIKKFCLLA